MKIKVLLKNQPYTFDSTRMSAEQINDLRKHLRRETRVLRRTVARSLRTQRDVVEEKKRRSRLRRVLAIKSAQIRHCNRLLSKTETIAPRRARRQQFAVRVEQAFMRFAEDVLAPADFDRLLEKARDAAASAPAEYVPELRLAMELAHLRQRVEDLEGPKIHN